MYNRAVKRLALSCMLLVLMQLFLGTVFTSDSQAASSAGPVVLNSVASSGSDSPFGLNISAAARYGIAGAMQVPLDSAAGTGAAWDREEFRWDMAAKPTGWDYGFADEVVNKAAQRGINVLALLDYNVDGSHTMPDLNGWGNYVRSIVTHFKGRVHYWEIWNEPENEAYLAGHNPADYARLLTTSYNIIKSIDPADQVVTAGVNGLAAPWLEQVMAAGGESHFDVIGVHPYVNFPASPESKSWLDSELAYWTAFAARHGNKPLWATEFGWKTSEVSESTQANYLARAYVEGLGAGLKKMFVYAFRDQSDALYGIVRSDWLTQKPAYGVYKNLVKQLNGATFQDKVDVFDNTRQTIDDFESGSNWWSYQAGLTANPSIVGNAHSGSQALRVDYQFAPNGVYAELGKSGAGGSHASVTLSGQPTKVGFWINGDNNAPVFKILLTDATGQLLVYEVGKGGTQGWHRLEAFLPGEHWASNGDMTLHYPLSFKSIQITRQPDPLEANFGGTVYLDDFYSESGPNVMDYRFNRNGKTLDVVWSDGGGGNVSLPTQSATAIVTDRNGQVSNLNATNGTLNFGIGDEMLFIEHQASSLTNPGPTGGGGSGNGGGTSGTCTKPVSNVQSANAFGNAAFTGLWNRYDLYAPGNRSYVWGNAPFAAGKEPYAQASSGSRDVLYFDKSRMEITHPEGDVNASGYVTNGLLTVELITGKIQTGDDQSNSSQYIQCAPAQIPVAGDNDDTHGPKYASLAARRSDSALALGAAVTRTIGSDGSLGSNGSLAGYGVVGGYYVPQTQHTIAKPFWDFLNNASQKIWVNGSALTGKLFDPWYVAPGLPITEAYWAKVKVNGQVKDVLIQAFERRVLTYTPSNPAAFQVEWGNIGRHYYAWRYGN